MNLPPLPQPRRFSAVPVAEVCGPDICQDHAGVVEAISFLPTGTALYDKATLEAAVLAEREACAQLATVHTGEASWHIAAAIRART